MNKQTFLKELQKRRPSIFDQYSYEELPDSFKGNDLLTINCCKHGFFQQKAYSHLYGQGCQICGKEKVIAAGTLTTEDFIKKSKIKFGDKFDYSKTNYVKKGVDLIITCPSHGDFTIRPEAHLWLPHGCPVCNVEIPREIKRLKFIEIARSVHGDKYDYSKVEFINRNSKVEIICPTHGSFWQNAQCHIGTKNQPGDNCPKCQIEKGRHTLESFIAKAKEVHGDKYDYSKVHYESIGSMLTIVCPEHGEFTQRAGSHLAGNRCKQCQIKESRHSLEEFISKAREVHGDKYDYSKAVYQGSKIHIEIICPQHGSFWQKPNGHLANKSGCRLCYESKGENMVKMFLMKYNFNFIQEYRITPYLYRYDFYLPDYNIFIEFHGLQHYRPVEIFGGIKALEETKKRDTIKETLVKECKGKLIIIPHSYFNMDAIDKYLIYHLKKIYRCWFVINDKVIVFKNEHEAYKALNVPGNVLLKNLTEYLGMTVPNFRVLF